MKQWIDKLRIAIIEEDMDTLMLLSEDIPMTKDIELATQACNLIEQAVRLATQKKLQLGAEINKLKTAQKYFK